MARPRGRRVGPSRRRRLCPRRRPPSKRRPRSTRRLLIRPRPSRRRHPPYPVSSHTPAVLHAAPRDTRSASRPEDPGPRSNPSGELELLLPAFAQDSAPEAPAHVGRMTGVVTPRCARPRPRRPAGGGLDFELGIPALKAPPAGFAPIGEAGLPPPAGLQVVEIPRPREALMAPEPRRSHPEMSAGHSLKAPLGILLSSLLVAVFDIVYFKLTGEHLALGPVRPFWVAAPLALFGVGFMLWRLVGVQHDDDA